MHILAFEICRFRIERASPLIEFKLSDPLGDIGGDSEGGEDGGEYRTEVGEDPI